MVKDMIYKCVSDNQITLHDLPDKLGKEQGKVVKVARWLLDNGALVEGENEILKVKDL